MNLSRMSGPVLLVLCFCFGNAQDQMPPSPVEFVTVRQHAVQPAVSLTGTVRARKAGTMASSVAGIVAERLVEEGRFVKRGQVLVRLNDGPNKLTLKTAEAGIEETRARLAQAHLDLKRTQDLFKKEIATQDNLDRARTEVLALENSVKRFTAQAAEIRDQIDRMTIRSSIDGVVVTLYTEVGSWLNPGGAVADIASLEEMEVLVQVPERYFSVFTRPAEARVSLPALDLELEAEAPVLIPHQIGTARTFPARIPFKTAGRLVPAGMLAEVQVTATTGDARLIIPKDGIVNNGDGFFVYTIGEGESVNPVPVTPGESVGQWIAVSGAIHAGDRIVTRGNERLMPGQVVMPKEATYELPKL
ncbi:MAG: efflux RND transporter periplasmic adaptor subunit [Acidobacteriota bacterium]|nr:efflux RND transporter periplasmic adaptor subunit [Acidobacteriota bacterium]